MTTPSGFTVTVEGDYFVAVGDNKKGLKRYSFDFNLPSMTAALSIIKNKVLNKMLKKLFNDYVSYRTYNITKVVPFGGAKVTGSFDIWSSSRDEVESYIRKEELPVKLKYYPSLMGLRDAVQLAQSDPDRFLLNQKELEEDFAFTESLRALNPEMYDDAEEAPKTVKVEEGKTETVASNQSEDLLKGYEL